jgi:RNA recognition motif-containing protein
MLDWQRILALGDPRETIYYNRDDLCEMKSIFVGNLSVSVTEAVLRSLFEACGTVERVSIMTDRDTGQPKGFGFVDMSDDGEAVKAIAALNGEDLEGRTLTVNEARPKMDRPRSDRPSGGGFGRKRW